MDNPEAELQFENDLQQWADTEGQNIIQRSTGQDVIAHARSRDQRIGQEVLRCEQRAKRAMAQREHMGK